MKILFTSFLTLWLFSLTAQNASQLYTNNPQSATNGSSLLKTGTTTALTYEECGTLATPDPNFSPERFEAFERQFLTRLNTRVPVRIPVRAHIMRTTSGTGGLTATELSNALAVVNSYYINANMEFYLCGSINYVNNNTYYDFDMASEAALRAEHYTTDIVNIYFCNTVSAGANSLCGYANFPWYSPRKDLIMMANSCATNGSTLAHELGHYFGLYHTHETSNGAELVARTNCDRAGDLLCDTPADPVLSSSNVNAACQYIGTTLDGNSVAYTPSARNLMSYSRKECRNIFTTQQYTRIAYYQQNSRAYLTCSGGGGTTVNLTKQAESLTGTGSSATFSVTIQNNGTASAGAFTVGFYASTNSGFTNRILLGRESFTSLTANGTATRTRTVDLCNVPLSSGTYYLGYFIDDQSQVAESNENDNIWFWSTSPRTITCQTVTLANLTKQTDALTGTGENVTFDITLRNSGNTAAGAFTVGFYASTSSTFTNPVRLGRESFTGLGVGATVSRLASYSLCNAQLPNGSYYVGYIIDDQNQVTETDETDNTWVWQSSPRTIACTTVRTCTGVQTLTTCPGTVTDGSGTAEYSNDLDCGWLIRPSTTANAITLSFSAFNIEDGFDYLYVYDGSSTNGTLLGVFSGSALPNSVTARSGSMYLNFVTDADVTYSGWTANYTCSNILQANLTSIAGAGTFSATGNSVTIGVPIVNLGTAAATSFRVGYYVSTNTSFTNPVYLGQNATVSSLAVNGRTDLTKTLDLCGASLPNGTYYVGYIIDDLSQVTEINENDNIWLWANNPITINCNTFCTTSTFTACSGTITDGSGTGNYQSNTNCSWLISPTGTPATITLNFTSFSTENTYDFVKVYDGTSANGTLLGTFSGSALPPTLWARTGSLFVQFITDASVQYDGWTANYVCSTTAQPNLTSTSGGSISTTTANSATIGFAVVNNGTGTAGAFRVGIYASTSSSFTNPVFVGQSQAVTSLAAGGRVDMTKTVNFCSTTLPSGTYYIGYIIDDQNQITELSESDNVWRFGSSLISVNCGTSCNATTTLTACPSSFDDGSGIDNYQHNLNCSWLIQPSGAPNSITLSFNSFATESGLDIVTVYDGRDGTGRLLGSFSGAALPPSVTATSGSMFVRFATDNSVAFAGWSASYACNTVPNQANLTANPNYGSLTNTNNNVTLNYQIVNNGTANAGAFRIAYFASTSSTFSSPIILAYDNVSSLATNGSLNFSKTINVCGTALTDGTYYFGFIIDDQNSIVESNENDNFWGWNTTPQSINCVTRYTISTVASPTNGGSTSGGGTNFLAGQTATVVATPNTGWEFVNWTESGTEVSRSTTYSFTVSANRSLIANFRQLPPQYSVSISANPSNGGSVSGGGVYNSGQTVTVLTSPNTGWAFINWTENGAEVSRSTSYSFNISGNRTLVANFRLLVIQYTVTVAASPSNGGAATGGGVYASGQTVNVSAAPNTGWEFINWTEGGAEVSRSTAYSFTVNANRSLIANFRQLPPQYTISTPASPTNGGTASGGGNYNAGQTATVVATPSVNWEFVNWTENGGQVSTLATYSFTVAGNRVLFANFRNITSVQIVVTVSPVGSGTVIGAGTYPVGGTVSLGAYSNNTNVWRFKEWRIGTQAVSNLSNYSFFAQVSNTYTAIFDPLNATTQADLGLNTVMIYPNPVLSDLTLSAQSIDNQEIDVYLVNALGVKQFVQKARLKSGDNQLIVPTHHLVAGVWFLSIQSARGQLHLKFVKN